MNALQELGIDIEPDPPVRRNYRKVYLQDMVRCLKDGCTGILPYREPPRFAYSDSHPPVLADGGPAFALLKRLLLHAALTQRRGSPARILVRTHPEVVDVGFDCGRAHRYGFIRSISPESLFTCGARIWDVTDKGRIPSIHASFLRADAIRTSASISPVVLVIEDNPHIRALVVCLLNRAGYRALPAVSGAAGLDIAESHAPDLIILDVCMPFMHGWEVLECLKANHATSGIPVVISDVISAEETAFRMGATDYLRKPVLEYSLLNCVGRILGRMP